jgi:hypothetical protein
MRAQIAGLRLSQMTSSGYWLKSMATATPSVLLNA